VRFDPCCVCR